MKGKVHHCCVRPAILYGSKAWYLKENKKAILRRMKRAMVRPMCGQKVVNKKMTEEHMDMFRAEGNYRSISNSKWSQMIWPCAEEG